jgi:cell division control protein 6
LTKIIFNNLLNPESLPPELPHRTREMKALAANYKFYFEPKIISNNLTLNQNINTMVLILGGPGQGKTSLVRLTTKEIVELGKQKKVNIHASYQNCWKLRSLVAVIGSVFEDLGIDGVKKGISLEEQISQYLLPYLAETGLHLILILDEINSLTPEEVNGLFSFTEFLSIHTLISLIFISRPTEWQLLVSPELNQRITETIILFPYEFDQIQEILNYRASLTLREGSYNEEIISMIAEITFSDQNIRLGLEILLRAAMEAENRKLKEIDPEFVREAKKQTFPELRSEILSELKVHELLTLLGIARRLSNKSFTTLNIKDGYRFYKNAAIEWYEEPKKESSFRSNLINLKSLGLINLQVSPTGRGKRGVRARISITDIPISIIIERVEEQLEKTFES